MMTTMMTTTTTVMMMETMTLAMTMMIKMMTMTPMIGKNHQLENLSSVDRRTRNFFGVLWPVTLSSMYNRLA